MKPETTDYRYSMTIYLIRDKRPKYWEFHCPYCTQKVCELDGRSIMGSDVVNNEGSSNPTMRVRCPGTSGKWCRMWYEFCLL